MKFGQLVDYKKILFLKNHTENKTRRLAPQLFFKALYEVKANGLQCSFSIS